MSVLEQSIRDLSKHIQAGELKPSELVDESLRRIQETDARIGAFVHIDEEGARTRAKVSDERVASDRREGIDLATLCGIPGGIKDNMCTVGMPTTCSSRILTGYQSPYDATVVSKLLDAGSIAVGKLNMDEFAMGSSTETSAWKLTRNPWNTDCVPGGSSGGSAAAVAAGQVPFTLGSDTGGSIRQPAAFCGVVGLKPTYGLVSRFGLVAFASSLDQIGPITRTVEDSAHVLQAIAGYDRMDSTSANVAIPDYSAALTGDIKGLRIGVPREYMGEGTAVGVESAVRNALDVLVSLGAKVEEISLPHTSYAVATYYLLAPAEASSNLARYDGVRYGIRADADDLIDMYKKTRSEGFGSEVKRRIMLGTYALSSGYYDAYYLRAQKMRTLIKRDFDQVFEQFDVIISPTSPTTAFRIGEQTDDPLTMYLNDICTIPVNLAGLPAISVPCGFADGLPVGLQVIGRGFDESTVLRVAHAYEQNSDAGQARPSL